MREICLSVRMKVSVFKNKNIPVSCSKAMVDIDRLKGCLHLKKERRVLDAEYQEVLGKIHLENLSTKVVEKLVFRLQQELDVRNQAKEVKVESTNLHEHRLKMQESSVVKMPSTKPLWLPVTTSQTVESPRWFNDLKRVEKPPRPKATPKEVSTELQWMSPTTSETLWEAGIGQKRDSQPLVCSLQPLPWYDRTLSRRAPNDRQHAQVGGEFW